MKPDPVAVLEELAEAANDVAAVLKHFTAPGSAPAAAVDRVLRRFVKAQQEHFNVRDRVIELLTGRKVRR